MKPLLYFCIGFASVAGPAGGFELQPVMTTAGKLLVSEDFSTAGIPASFRSPRTPNAFAIAAGALQATSQAGQPSSTHGVFAIEAHDLTIAFKVKFLQPANLFVGVDGYSELFRGNTHLVRFSLTPESMGWDQKRGGPASKHAVGEAMKAARLAKQPLPAPTAEQLADPTFFRTEELAAVPIDCDVGSWHDVLLEINGNDLVAQVDGQTLLATSTVADAAKNRIGFGMVKRATLLIDDVRIWDNKRRADWDEVKSTLSDRQDSKP
ncbi:MAG TPA: hypothetical protein VG713_19385 [Pirellulales bacterium]|nr:hypothetical protein [Pirellulales bacterium]